MTGSRRRRAPSIWTTLLIGLAAGLPVSAAAAADDAVPLALTGRFQLIVDGEIDRDARIFLTKRGKPHLLIDAASLANPLVVAVGARRAAPVDAAGLAGADLTSDAIAVPAAALDTGADAVPVQPSRGGVQMRVGGRSLQLGPSDPLLGLLRAEDLLKRLPEYRRNAAEYSPGAENLRLLAAVEEPITIDVVFGSWCPHCEQVVPRLLRVMQEIDNPNLTFRFHGVTRSFTEDPVSRQFKVAALPTFVLSRGPERLGRLEGPALETPEAALVSAIPAR